MYLQQRLIPRQHFCKLVNQSMKASQTLGSKPMLCCIEEDAGHLHCVLFIHLSSSLKQIVIPFFAMNVLQIAEQRGQKVNTCLASSVSPVPCKST